jgi:outer membrane protein TolC
MLRRYWWFILLALSSMAMLQPAAAQQRPPSRLLLRSLEGFARDVQQLDQAVPDENHASPPPPLSETELQALDLPAPSALALPMQVAAVTTQRRVRLSLPQALALAVRNDPDLAEQVAAVQERQGLLAAVQGRLLPELGLVVGGAFSQLRTSNVVWQDNAALYSADSPFLVKPNGRNTIQTNLGLGYAALRVDYELLSFERTAALGQLGASLAEARQRYANRVRQLQLDVSEAYYGLQLADQSWRIRQAVTRNDTVVRDQVAALKAIGLVPRVDLLRAEADLQQGRYRLSQADAQRLSRQRQLSNLINVPFDVTLVAPEAIRLLPPWPLDLQQTLIRGWTDNPQLLALQQARQALLLQADRQAARLLPSLRLFAQAGVANALTTRPVVNLEGCCAESVIPQLNTVSADWAAGLSLNWKLFDGGVTAGEVSASRAAAQRTEQASARERNAIRQRLESAYFDHTASLDQIIAARAAYRAAREAFRDVRARYQLGLADYTDVSDTIRRFTEAMEARAESVTLANVSYARLLRELLPVSDRPGQLVELPLVLP